MERARVALAMLATVAVMWLGACGSSGSDGSSDAVLGNCLAQDTSGTELGSGGPVTVGAGTRLPFTVGGQLVGIWRDHLVAVAASALLERCDATISSRSVDDIPACVFAAGTVALGAVAPSETGVVTTIVPISAGTLVAVVGAVSYSETDELWVAKDAGGAAFLFAKADLATCKVIALLPGESATPAAGT